MEPTQKQFDDFVNGLVAAWSSGYVSRHQTEKFTGGALSPGTVINRELHDQCPGRLMIGKKMVFPVREFAIWIAERYLQHPSYNSGRSIPHLSREKKKEVSRTNSR